MGIASIFDAMRPAKRNTTFIYYLVGLVMLSLIAMQFFWIRNSYRLEKLATERRLKEDIDKAVQDVEEDAFCFTVYSKTYIKKGEGIYMIQQPSSKGVFFGKPDSMNLYNVFADTKDTMFYNAHSISFEHYAATVDVTLKFSFVGANPLKRYDSSHYLLHNLSQDNFKEVLADKFRITDAIDTSLLDELVKAALKKNRLDTVYEIGIRKQGDAQYEYVSKEANVSNLANASVRSEMLINKFSKPYEVVLYVPNSFRVILRSMAVIVLSSIIIVVFLVCAYAYFVRTILNQKRLADMKNTFINNITHEFRTPITNIGLAVENSQENNDKAAAYMGIIEEENKRIERNVEQILQLATLENANGKNEYADTDIHSLVNEAIDTFRIQLQKIDGTVTTNFNANDPVIKCNKEQVKNMLQNLIDNAIKYRNGAPQITITTQCEAGSMAIEVMDKGIGMNAETQKYIFERFYRGRTGDRHDVKGFGLGLSYVKYIVDAHYGQLQVKSKPGNGTSFTIHLPIDPLV